MLASVRYVTGKVFADYAVPIRGVLHVEEFLYGLCDFFLCVSLVYGGVHLLFNVLLHIRRHFADNPLYVSFSHFCLL